MKCVSRELSNGNQLGDRQKVGQIVACDLGIDDILTSQYVWNVHPYLTWQNDPI